MSADPVAIARDLLRCPSVTPAEGGALAFLEKTLKAAGFAVHRMTFREAGTADVENLYARIGTAAPNLVFAGHTDVVPPGDEAAGRIRRSPARSPTATLYGRGAVDMKGGDRLRGRRRARSSRRARRQAEGLDLVPDHRRRGRHRGQRHAQAAGMGGRARREFDHCILGEPSNRDELGDTIKIGRRGSLNGTLIVTGKQGHVAYPQRADNPVRGLVTLIARAAGRAARPGSAQFDAVAISNSPRSMSATRPSISFPARRARASTSASTTTTRSDSLKTLIEQRAAKAAGGKIRCAFEWEPSNADVFVTEPGPFTDLVAERDRGGDRAQAGALDHRRHLGRALHQGLLPGGRIRPGRPDHAPGRRARAGRRSARADGDLSEDPRSVFRVVAAVVRQVGTTATNFNNPPAPDRARPAARPGRRRCGRARRAPREIVGAPFALADRRPASRPSSAPDCAGTSARRRSLSTSSPSRSTSSRSSVFTGDLAWHSVERKVVKSCLPTSRCAASCIARGIERARHAPGAAGVERQIGAAVDDAIEIMAPDRRGARVEIVGDTFGRENGDRMRAQMRIERVAHGVGIPVLREIDMGDLRRAHARRHRCGRRLAPAFSRRTALRPPRSARPAR